MLHSAFRYKNPRVQENHTAVVSEFFFFCVCVSMVVMARCRKTPPVFRDKEVSEVGTSEGKRRRVGGLIISIDFTGTLS